MSETKLAPADLVKIMTRRGAFNLLIVAGAYPKDKRATFTDSLKYCRCLTDPAKIDKEWAELKNLPAAPSQPTLFVIKFGEIVAYENEINKARAEQKLKPRPPLCFEILSHARHTNTSVIIVANGLPMVEYCAQMDYVCYLFGSRAPKLVDAMIKEQGGNTALVSQQYRDKQSPYWIFSV